MRYSRRYLKNKIIHFLVFGSIYLNIEIFSRASGGALVGFNGISKLSLCGWTSLWMFPIGGFCAVLIGSLNDRQRYYNLKMWQQVLMGGSLITAAELLSGVFFNLYLRLSIWDYSYDKFNFLGQICLENCIYWYLLSVVIIWLDDVLSYYHYGEEKPASLLNYFKRLVTLQ
jgi:Predicted membrane protein